MSDPTTRAVSRTAPCPCGSGRRYKDCHGALSGAPTLSNEQRAHQLALEGLAAHQQHDLALARDRYAQAIALSANHFDALHMLGMVHFELNELSAAAAYVVRALDATQWQPEAMRHNLGLVLSKLIALRDGVELDYGMSPKARRYRELIANAQVDATPTRPVNPLVSVVIPSFNHAQFLPAALESVYAQTYREIELIVIDDGSTDASADIAAASLERCPFANRLIRRENRGAHATLNEAIAMSTGHYINPLNSDDLFAPERIERLVHAVTRFDTELAFSATDFIDANTVAIDPFADARVYSLRCRQASVPFRESVGNALLLDNVAVTTGNLFFSRTLFDALGGFRDFRYNHDWDLCLRALWLTEPHFVDALLYRYRFHSSNTISESAEKNRAEALLIHTEYLAKAFDARQAGGEFTPNLHQWGNRFVVDVLRCGLSSAVPAHTLKAYAQSVLATIANEA